MPEISLVVFFLHSQNDLKENVVYDENISKLLNSSQVDHEVLGTKDIARKKRYPFRQTLIDVKNFSIELVVGYRVSHLVSAFV